MTKINSEQISHCLKQVFDPPKPVKITLLVIGILGALAIVPGIVGIIGVTVSSAPGFMILMGETLTIYGSVGFLALSGGGIVLIAIESILLHRDWDPRPMAPKEGEKERHAKYDDLNQQNFTQLPKDLKIVSSLLDENGNPVTLPQLTVDQARNLIDNVENSDEEGYAIIQLTTKGMIKTKLKSGSVKGEMFEPVKKGGLLFIWTKGDHYCQVQKGYDYTIGISDLKNAFGGTLPQKIEVKDV